MRTMLYQYNPRGVDEHSVYHVYTAPDSRGKGIAKRLLKAVIADFGGGLLHLEVGSFELDNGEVVRQDDEGKNGKLRRLYESVGFRDSPELGENRMLRAADVADTAKAASDDVEPPQSINGFMSADWLRWRGRKEQRDTGKTADELLRMRVRKQETDLMEMLGQKVAAGEVPRTGPEAIQAALARMDIEALRTKAMVDVKVKSRRTKAVKMLNLLQGLDRNKVTPAELMVTRVPVIPPSFRPFSLQGTTFIPGDANELYRDLVAMRDAYDDEAGALGPEAAAETFGKLRGAIRAVYGYGDPVEPKTLERGVSGFMKHIVGKGSSKHSFFQKRMISKPMDNSGMSVVTVDPDLGMDEVGIPEDMAWDLYKTYIQRRLVRKGFTAANAVRAIRDRSDDALREMQFEVKDRPVIYSRAPAWHKWNMIAGNPTLIKGNAIAVSPLVTSGMNMDFNGDDQKGKILVLMDKNIVENNPHKSLEYAIPDATVLDMINKQIVPTYNIAGHSLHLVDLEEFPKGDLIRHKLDGRNGGIYFYGVPEGTRVIALDEETHTLEWAPVAFYSVHPQRRVELVDLSNGRQVCTDDDPRAVYGIDPSGTDWGLVRTTPTDAKARNLIVPCVRDVEGACRDLGALDRMHMRREGRSDLEIPLDWNTGWLLGALAGDGWWDKREYNGRRSVYLSDLQGSNAARAAQVLRALFGNVSWARHDFKKDEHEGRYGDTVRHTFHFSEAPAFCEFLSYWLGGGASDNSTGSGSKHLPDVFLLASREFREGLLCGIVDTDGSVSVSNAKGAPQLLCAMTSTSLRLASDVKFLALTLGITSTISFSKTTGKGNTSWIATLSAPDCKRLNVFRNLASEHKRECFLRTEVSQEKNSLMFNKTFVPLDVYARVNADLPTPKITEKDRGNPGGALERKKHLQNMNIQWSKAKCGLLSRPLVYRIFELMQELDDEGADLRRRALEDLEKEHDVATPDRVDLWRKAILATCPRQDTTERYKQGKWAYAKTNLPLRQGSSTGRGRASIAAWIRETPQYVRAHKDPRVLQWKALFVDNESLSWASITDVHKTGIKEDGYDLTVPGFETFMSADGVILSNTSAVHVPALPESVNESYDRLMPSKMLLSTRDTERVVNQPKHEQVLGLHNAQVRQAKAVHKFSSKDEALQAVRSGGIPMSDEVEYPGMPVF